MIQPLRAALGLEEISNTHFEPGKYHKLSKMHNKPFHINQHTVLFFITLK